MLRKLFVILLIYAGLCLAPANAQSDQDRAAIEAAIAGQIAAFRADDGATAYGFASPTIQQIFPSADIFMAMVKKGYPQVYRPQSFRFEAVAPDPLGRLIQRVRIIGPDGRTYEAVYTMEREPDGTWKINGCAIAEVPGVDA